MGHFVHPQHFLFRPIASKFSALVFALQLLPSSDKVLELCTVIQVSAIIPAFSLWVTAILFPWDRIAPLFPVPTHSFNRPPPWLVFSTESQYFLQYVCFACLIVLPTTAWACLYWIIGRKLYVLFTVWNALFLFLTAILHFPLYF